jgi:DNA-binding beta-propeller fold protein YncE/cytochrome b involved in lipid metabolism
MEFFSYIGLHTAYLLVFSITLGLGIGASALSYVLFLFSGKDGKISCDESKLLKISRIVIWVAILLYGFSGLGLFTLAYESMVELGIFYASMTVAIILIGNEIMFTARHLPRVRNIRDGNIALDAFVLESGAVSVVSWVFLMFHHVIYRTDIGYFAFMALYAAAIAVAVFVTWFIRRKSVRSHDVTILKRSVLAALFLALIFAGAWYAKADRIIKPAEIGKRITTELVGTTYTLDDVALHNNTEDCWLIIDKKVFNATEASRLHPAMFNCGKDVSDNYHKNHGEGIRDKMMKYYIGELRSGTGVSNVDVPFEKNETLKPYRELYVDEGSWNPRELMLVVEKDAEKLLAIDGTTHKVVGRVHDVGFQPHTSVYSSDARYMYIISRDGWLTKIDLTTLEPIVSVLVGENSRGTAITDNDKYVAIGNYEPGNLVILDAVSMQILKTIPLTMEKDGKQIESRAGAVVEDGNRIIVALKDGTSVWSIDTDQSGFPVTHKFSDIGDGKPALHDAFLTPNGSHYIVASQGSKTVWVLDVGTMEPIAEVETGETPHTGPGAAWGNYIYIPSLGEGIITVIDITTWKPVKYIKTGGPGLFVRSYSKDPSYPYVWADTAFGDHKDEIYVIDARINEIVKTIIPVKGEASWHPEFTYDGKFVYVVSQSANEVEVYDALTFEIVKRIKSDTPSAISNVGLRIEEPGL